MGERLQTRLIEELGDHPHVGDIRAGKGLLAAVELVEDRATKKPFAADRKIAGKVHVEMRRRGVVTRTRPASNGQPPTGDAVFFAPPLVVTGEQIDQFVRVAREAIDAVLAG
jgi:adenosylmethionine-8-amino-7-oxononanoate aminotransferase